MSARAVFRCLVEAGPATRPQIGQTLGLSRPTMSAATAELERLGYIEVVGAVQGALGRKAAQYRVGPGAGHVIAVDAGSTHVRVRVATLDRQLLHSRVHRLSSSHFLMNEEISAAVADEVNAAIHECRADRGPLRAIGIALPTRVVGPDQDHSATRQDILFSHFTPPDGVDIVLENNVNCAAVAERHHGVAKGRETFAYVQIGLKIGMGLILSGQLLRGHNGAAGEIGHLTFPFAPGLVPEPGEVERYMGTEALMGRVRADWPADGGPVPQDAADLVARAEAGEPAASAHIARHADDIGALVAACVAVVDPGLVVLGGGLGAAKPLPERVEAVARRLSYPVEVVSTGLGVDATALGIEKLAVDRALVGLLGEAA
ncbi:ROK family transcriptional regulator [Acuticoccus sp. M5D2P5]|uniref:ROK family transcriptional regulator n=1 Tax=Acuticoccus kalidii TaxID=2910977 RepID=UPI001F3DCCA2|nr:ROK family transcriptional regulator [Acuticoccus kalidii]MCF3932093.1 ROK family transcriptional regulator [Acuticoccus kalidii]